jgi:hypothetical protein
LATPGMTDCPPQPMRGGIRSIRNHAGKAHRDLVVRCPEAHSIVDVAKMRKLGFPVDDVDSNCVHVEFMDAHVDAPACCNKHHVTQILGDGRVPIYQAFWGLILATSGTTERPMRGGIQGGNQGRRGNKMFPNVGSNCVHVGLELDKASVFEDCQKGPANRC